MPPTTRCPRRSARTCTSALPNGSRPTAAICSSSTRSSATTWSRRTATAPSSAPPPRAQAALAERAAGYLASSGRQAYGRGDAPAAVRLLERATALLPPESSERLKLLPSLGEALTEVGAWDDARTLLSEAAATARNVEDRGTAAEAAVELVYVELHTDAGASHAKATGGARARDSSVRGARRQGRPLRARCAPRRMIYAWAGESARALEEMERAARIAEESGDRMQEQRSRAGDHDGAHERPLPVDDVLEKLDELESRVEGTPRLQMSDPSQPEPSAIRHAGDGSTTRAGSSATPTRHHASWVSR